MPSLKDDTDLVEIEGILATFGVISLYSSILNDFGQKATMFWLTTCREDWFKTRFQEKFLIEDMEIIRRIYYLDSGKKYENGDGNQGGYKLSHCSYGSIERISI